MSKAKTNKNEVYFRFLEELRQSGKINMFGAAPYLAQAFDIPKPDATKIFWDWTKSRTTY